MENSPSLRPESAPRDQSNRKMYKHTSKICEQMQTIPDNSSNDIDNDMRRQLGRLVVDTQQTIDSNLTLFRLGLLVTIAASIAVSIKNSGLLNRVNNVEEIPLWQFAQRKKLRVRMIRQSQENPSVFYVFHTPFLRRIVLKDSLPQSLALGIEEQKKNDLIAVRLFGVQVDECAREWVWSNFVSSHESMTIQLLQRIKVEGSDSVASCNIALRRTPLRKDFAKELVSHGYAECIPENLEKHENGLEHQRLHSVSKLSKQLKSMLKLCNTASGEIGKKRIYPTVSFPQANELQPRVLKSSSTGFDIEKTHQCIHDSLSTFSLPLL